MSGKALSRVVDGARVFGAHVNGKAATGTVGSVGSAAVEREAVVQAQGAGWQEHGNFAPGGLFGY